MRVFITGASGWIGSAAVDALLADGHEVTGLARSDASSASLAAKGALVLRGDLDDLDSIRAGSEAADAVLHLANKHDFANPAVSNLAERNAVETIGETLKGSNRPFLLASGVAGLAQGRPSVESDPSFAHGLDSPRGGSENRALEFVAEGVTTVSLRFSPTVHGTGDHGFIAVLVEAAKRNGVAGYVGDGSNGWAAVHVSDAGRLIGLALDKAEPGRILHAVAENSVSTRTIAEAIGRSLGLPTASVAPEDAVSHFGFLGTFFSMDLSSDSTVTREFLGWTPTGPTLVEDLDAGAYATA
jgi:nucleoside-diphosphate-sugar epimerase